MSTIKILAISAGMTETKKPYNLIRKRIRYLNYGLLGLATLIKHNCNRDIIMFQGEYSSPSELLSTINNAGINIANECEVILLSIPSSYSISWCKSFCKIIKDYYGTRVIVGGRWVVDNNENWIRENLIYIDQIITGFGEQAILQMFNTTGNIYDGSKKCFEWFDYSILFEYEKYQPCIEISRGCGSGCQFCADSSNMRTKNKNVNLIYNELDILDTFYDDYSLYLQAPHFIFEKQWVDDLSLVLEKRKSLRYWRCTTRVESVDIKKLPSLRQSGLKVIDIGLESASKRQLIKMHKTNDPDKYLSYAEKILDECWNNGIWVKFNILLYAGETYDTLSETIEWLKEHKSKIKDVSASGLVYYQNMGEGSLNALIKEGASLANQQQLKECGFSSLNLSSEISARSAEQIAVEIPRIVANQRDFFDIKKISYFENGYTYPMFLEDLKKCDPAELPFRIEV